MKVTITYKFPDAVYEAARYAAKNEDGVDQEELYDRLLEIMGSSEYVDVEVDTETGEKRVVERKRW